MTPAQARKLEAFLSPSEKYELQRLIEADMADCVWRPLPGPQTMAAESLADVTGFGGAAGGGKTDLAIGLALTAHHRAQVFRREGPQLKGIIDRLKELVDKDLIAGNPPVYTDGERQIEFNAMPYLGDEKKFQGRPKDLLVIDEAANFLEAQVRFVKGWVRTSRPGQRTRTLMTFNPPTTSEGRWVIGYFGPWLDVKNTLYPTDPGKLRYVYVDPADGKDVWIPDDNPRQFVLVDGERVYDFDHDHYSPEQIVQPESRTFIPSRITDNPFLVSTGYMTQLQSLPEPLRSQMLLGDFKAGVKDSPWQVIPTAWVDIAQARWRERSPRGEMMSMGVDVARGGADQTMIATRHKTESTSHWYDRLSEHPGSDTPNGNIVAGLVIGVRRDHAPIHIDIIGVGASPYDVLNSAGLDVYGVNASHKATSLDKSGALSFKNMRSQLWWQFRELLDPAADNGIALPPGKDVAAELCAPMWEMSGMTIQVESRDDIIKRVGRSPDRATAIIQAAIDTPKIRMIASMSQPSAPCLDHDPYRRL